MRGHGLVMSILNADNFCVPVLWPPRFLDEEKAIIWFYFWNRNAKTSDFSNSNERKCAANRSSFITPPKGIIFRDDQALYHRQNFSHQGEWQTTLQNLVHISNVHLSFIVSPFVSGENRRDIQDGVGLKQSTEKHEPPSQCLCWLFKTAVLKNLSAKIWRVCFKHWGIYQNEQMLGRIFVRSQSKIERGHNQDWLPLLPSNPHLFVWAPTLMAVRFGGWKMRDWRDECRGVLGPEKQLAPC